MIVYEKTSHIKGPAFNDHNTPHGESAFCIVTHLTASELEKMPSLSAWSFPSAVFSYAPSPSALLLVPLI